FLRGPNGGDMRTITSLCLAVLLSVSSAAADVAASREATAAATDSVAQQHDQLRQLKATMEKAINSRDLDALLANVDENVVFTTMNGDVAHGREAVRAYYQKMMDGPDKVVESVTTSFIPDALSIFYGDDVAVAWGATDDHYVLANGSKFNIKGRWTATM